MSGTNLRTIWLTLRATNYTTAVFTNVITNLTNFDSATKRAINSSLMLGKSAMAVGMITGVLGQQLGGTAGQILTYVSYTMYAVGAMAYAKAGIIVLNTILIKHGIIMGAVIINWQTLAVAIGAAVAAFLIVMAITNTFGKTAGLVTGLTIAIMGLVVALIALKAIASGGTSLGLDAAVMAGVGAIAGGMAGMVYAGTHQMGTRMVGATGPAFLHKGEVIYNPSTGRPTQVGNDLQGNVGMGSMIDASMHIDNVNTKMDIEEMNKLLKKQGRTIAQNNR